MANSPESVAHAFVRAINRQDAAALSELLAAQHRFVDSLGNVVTGREKVCGGWIGYFRMVPDYSIAIEETYCDGPVVLMLGIACGSYVAGEGSKDEQRWKTPVALRVQVEDGFVSEWRVYADNEPLRELMRKNAK